MGKFEFPAKMAAKSPFDLPNYTHCQIGWKGINTAVIRIGKGHFTQGQTLSKEAKFEKKKVEITNYFETEMQKAQLREFYDLPGSKGKEGNFSNCVDFR